jgi:hypothetical protein
MNATTVHSAPLSWVRIIAAAMTVSVLSWPVAARAEETGDAENARPANRAAPVALFIAGAVTGLTSHEGGHLFFDVLFDADPGVRRVEFGGVPFFAITHRGDLSARREYAISSAGFWTQHALSEWVLTSRPRLRTERNPFLKGVLAWHLLSSAAYTLAATGGLGPPERDTRGMAFSLGVAERWVGAVLAVPLVCDTWRYFDPDAAWARWLSRAAKIAVIVAAASAGG